MSGAARPRRRRTVRGALWLIAALLAASGAIRVATGTGGAIAREMQAVTLGSNDDPAACEPAPEIATVLAALAARDRQLAEREAAVEDRAAALALTEQVVADNIAALDAAEARLAETLALADGAAEADLGRLTSVYENMKAKEASALFEEMDPGFAAGFLGRMRADAAAAIMAGLSPETAYTISVMLAGRNAAVPTE